MEARQEAMTADRLAADQAAAATKLRVLDNKPQPDMIVVLTGNQLCCSGMKPLSWRVGSTKVGHTPPSALITSPPATLRAFSIGAVGTAADARRYPPVTHRNPQRNGGL